MSSLVVRYRGKAVKLSARAASGKVAKAACGARRCRPCAASPMPRTVRANAHGEVRWEDSNAVSSLGNVLAIALAVSILGCAGAARAADDYPEPCRALARRLSAGRFDRHLRPPDRTIFVGAPRPAVRDREQAGRGQQPCRPKWPRNRRRTATRCSWSIRPTPSTPRSIKIFRSISSRTWRPSRASSACRT